MALAAGLALVESDRLAKRGRDDALATSFPTADPGSISRFQAHYAGRIASGKPRPGAICVYQLAALTETELGLTPEGLTFARLPNPLLDGTGTPSRVLSDDEREALVDLIARNVPGERQAFEVLLAAIRRGCTRFEELVLATGDAVPGKWTSQVLKTQVAGTLARMNDLGLTDKVRQGRRVIYGLSKAGNKTLMAWIKNESIGVQRVGA